MESPKIKALDFRKLPKAFQKYEHEEKILALRFVNGKCVLDVGCGYGRAASYMEGVAGYYYGIDNDRELLEAAEKKKYLNAFFVEGDIQNLTEYFSDDSMEVSISLFNTLGCVEDPEKVMRGMRAVTKERLLFTVMAKGTLPLRKKYYDAIGCRYNIDRSTETIESDMWGKSRAYSIGEAMELARKTGWEVTEIGTLAELLYYVIATKPIAA